MDLNELQKKYSKDKPTFSIKELMICSILIIIGLVLFLAMPEDMGIIGWVLFSLGTFLIVVGVFRLAATLSEVQSDFEKKIRLLISIIISALAQCAGLFYLYKSGGTGKGIAICVLALCISLGLIIYAVDFDDEKLHKKIVLACRIITIILLAIALVLNIRTSFSNAAVYVGTILVIEALITGRTGFKK